MLLEFARVLGVRAATALMGPVVAWCIFNVLLCYSVFVKNPVRTPSLHVHACIKHAR